MILKLNSSAWDWILEGLDLYREQQSEWGKEDKASLIHDLIKSLEKELGTDVVGGRIDGYWFYATIRGRKRRIEIRIVDDE